MKFVVMHYFEGWEKDKKVSDHKTFEEAEKVADKLNECASSYELYYAEILY